MMFKRRKIIPFEHLVEDKFFLSKSDMHEATIEAVHACMQLAVDSEEEVFLGHCDGVALFITRGAEN